MALLRSGGIIGLAILAGCGPVPAIATDTLSAPEPDAGISSDPSHVQGERDMQIVEESIQSMPCEPRTGVENTDASLDVCNSETGLDVFVLTDATGCHIGIGEIPKPVEYGYSGRQCRDPLIWRIDGDVPVGFIYRVSENEPDDIFPDRGTWFVSAIKSGTQDSCRTDRLSGRGSKAFAVQTLAALEFPFECPTHLMWHDVN